MALYVYNSLTRQKEEFVPIVPGRVHMYVCGPTVYDDPHIGHAKSYISFDLIVRYLRYLGYKVRYVQNITDVGHLLDSGEDRILLGAKREQTEPMELVERYTRAYFEAMDALNVQRPDISPHAAAHIPEQIDLTQKLLENGYAYEINGSVYFDVGKFMDYGKLSGRKVEDQQAGARIDINPEKHHPADFALWKRAEEGHIMQWNSPWGRGYPGWHIECSAMAMKYLGEQIDIHGGGLENQFPHHECEIAQSEAATGKPFVKYWLHNNMVLVDDTKMSKSLGNSITISDAMLKFNGEQIRFFILQSHYRSTLDFDDDAIAAAGQGWEKLYGFLKKIQFALTNAKEGNSDPSVIAATDHAKKHFESAMNDDFNSPLAIAHLFDYSREINKIMAVDSSLSREALGYIQDTFLRLGRDVLGLFYESQDQAIQFQPFVELLIKIREKIRQNRDWETSDFIRDGLKNLGVILEDSKQGTRWSLKN